MLSVGEKSGKEYFECELFEACRSRDRYNRHDDEELIKAADPTHPWKSAKIEHLLAFGAAFPLPPRYPLRCWLNIVALGSPKIFYGDVSVPCIEKGPGPEGDRSLTFVCDRLGGWRCYDAYVLAVREIPVSNSMAEKEKEVEKQGKSASLSSYKTTSSSSYWDDTPSSPGGMADTYNDLHWRWSAMSRRVSGH